MFLFLKLLPLFLLTVMGFASPSLAQGRVTLGGRLIGFPEPVHVELYSSLGDRVCGDSVSNSRFELGFDCPGGDRYRLQLTGKACSRACFLYLDAGKFYLEWNSKKIFPEFIPVNAGKGRVEPEEARAGELAIGLNKMFLLSKTGLFPHDSISAFVQKNRSSPLSTFLLETYLAVEDEKTDWRHIAALYSSLTPAATDNIAGIRLAIRIEQHNTLPPGSHAPSFSSFETNGKKFKLHTDPGQYLLLDFWASWCPPCRDENRALSAALKRGPKKHLQVIAVSLDKVLQDARLAALADDAFWTQIWDGGFIHTPAALLYEVKSIPANFLIGPDGKIIWRNLHGAALLDALEKIH